MADIQFAHPVEARNGSDIVVIESVSSVQSHSALLNLFPSVLQALKLSLLIGSARVGILAGVQLDSVESLLLRQRDLLFIRIDERADDHICCCNFRTIASMCALSLDRFKPAFVVTSRAGSGTSVA